MKRSSLFYVAIVTSLVAAGIVVSCQKQPATTAQNNTHNKGTHSSAHPTNTTTAAHPYFHKGVGGPVDSATTNQWKRKWKQKYGTTVTSSYILPSLVFTQLLDKAGTAGISFYNAQDQNGKRHILLIGVSESGVIMPTERVTTLEGLSIDWQTAKSWRATYTGAVKALFQGYNTFDRLIKQQGSLNIRINMGINDENTEVVLLSNAADPSPTDEQDVSRPCPPYCSDSELL